MSSLISVWRFFPQSSTYCVRRTHSTFLAAGHEISAKALVWYFYAIEKHPEAQARIREEIALVRARVDPEEFTVTDLDSMECTLATLKVVSDLMCACWLSQKECRSQ